LEENGQCKFWWSIVGLQTPGTKAVMPWARPVSLAADPDKRICRPARWMQTHTLGSLLTCAWGL